MGFVVKQPSRMQARAMFFSKLGGTSNNFRSDSKKSWAGEKCLRVDLPPPGSDIPISSWEEL
jgi:hypothetical protein